MTLGEAYLKDILRAPPTDHIPANVAHPFQKSFYTYFTKRFVPKHWYLAVGFGFALTLYGTLDGLREQGKKKQYDEAMMEGRQPCKCSTMTLDGARDTRWAWVCPIGHP